jgi:outer membrane autotransporter protein
MKSSHSLNTRLLPLSILISSLLSAGAMAATAPEMPEFNASQYKDVEPKGDAVKDENKWTQKSKDEIEDIQELINNFKKVKDAAELALANGVTFAENEQKVTDLAGADAQKTTADLAVTTAAGAAKAPPGKFGAVAQKETALIAAVDAGNSDNNNADKQQIEALITAVRTTQEAYQTALVTEKAKVVADAEDPTIFSNNIESLKNAYEAAIKALNTDSLTNAGGTVIEKYQSAYDEFIAEIGLDANTKGLNDSYSDIVAFKDLVQQKADATTKANELQTAKDYLTNNQNHKLTDAAKAEQQAIFESATASLETGQKELANITPTQGVATVTAGTLARNEIVDKEDQTIETGGASLNAHIIGQTQHVSDGATAVDTVVSQSADGSTAGRQILAAGATSIRTTVQEGSFLENNGGTDFYSIIETGGTLTLKGVKANTTTNADDVDKIAKSVNATIQAGGKATLDDLSEAYGMKTSGTVTAEKGSKSFDTIIEDGAYTLKDGAKAEGTIFNNGTFTVEKGAEANHTTLNNDVTFNLVEGATADNTIVNQDATFTLGAKAKTTGTVLNGSTFVLDVDQIADNTTVNDGATFTLKDGAKTTGTILNNSELTITDKQTADNTTVNKGAKFKLTSGAITKDTIIDGGVFDLAAGTTADNTTLKSGDFTLIKDAKADNTTVNGGKFTLADGALTNGTTVSGGVFEALTGSAATNTTVTNGLFALKDGAQANTTLISGGEFTVADKSLANKTQLDGGKFTLESGANALETIVSNGLFTINNGAKAEDTMLNGGHLQLAGTLDNLSITNASANFINTAKVSGDIDAKTGSMINVNQGADTAEADLTLAGRMALLASDVAQAVAPATSRAARAASNSSPEQFTFKNVNLQGGIVDMSNAKNSQLTMNTLAGNGNFILGSIMQDDSAAPLNVLGEANGDFTIEMNGSGKAPTNLNVINTGGGSARFALANGPVALGNYMNNLVRDANGNFVLTADKTALTPGTAGILAVANTTPVIFNAELSSIQQRLDNQSTEANESGMWGTYLNNNFEVKGRAANFDQKLNGMTLGGDKATALGDGVLSIGGFAGYSSSDIKTDYQSKGKVESHSFGAYAQYLANSGYYLNGVVKNNQFSQDVNITALNGSASGVSNFSGMGVAVKAGKHINFNDVYVSPYVGVSAFSSGKNAFSLSNGMEAQSNNTHSTIGTIGVNAGYRVVMNNGATIKPYALFAVDHEFAKNNQVMVNDEAFDNNLNGTRVNTGAGLNVDITPNLSVGSEVKLSSGKDIKTPMTINLSVGYTF